MFVPTNKQKNMNAMNPYIIPLLKTYDISVQIKDVKIQIL